MNKKTYRIMSFILALMLFLGEYANVSASAPSSGQMPQSSKIYYVNPTGNDANPGTATAPFKTLTKGASVLVAGDTLIVTGTFNQTLVISNSGTANAPINVIGNAAILNMNGAQGNGIKIIGNYINISGFEVKGTMSHGVLISGENIKFENSSVHHSVLENGSGTCSGAGGWGSAIKVMIGGENVVIRGNTVYENCGEGIGVTRGVNVLVENNTVRDNYSVNIYLDNSPYTTAQKNNVTCTGTYLRDGRNATGIAVAEEEYSGWGAQRHDNYVLNNFVAGCYDGITSWQPEVDGGKLINAVISGNTVASGTRRSIYISSENQNVLIANNTLFGDIVVNYPNGVTVKNNTIGGSPTATATPISSPTNTPIVAASLTATSQPTTTPIVAASLTATSQPSQPTATPIVAASLTATNQPSQPTATPIVVASPTATAQPYIQPTDTLIPASPTQIYIPPTATPPSTAGQPGFYDDKNENFSYSKGWKDVDAMGAYNGSYKTNSNYGSSVSLSFTGASFSILYTDGANYRQMSVYVDGVLIQTIKRSTSKTIYQKRWDYPGKLSAGTHKVKLVFINGNGTFDAIIVHSTAISLASPSPSPTPVPIITQIVPPSWTLPLPTQTPIPPTIVPSETPTSEPPTPMPTP